MNRLFHSSIIRCDATKCENVLLHRRSGWGNPQSNILFVGFSPGLRRQDRWNDECSPFDVSDSEENGFSAGVFKELIKSLGIKTKDFYVTNYIKCALDGATNKMTMDRCFNLYLLNEILSMDPKVIITFGNVMNKELRLNLEHYLEDRKYQIFKMYHPSYVSRFKSKTYEKWKDQVKKLRLYIKENNIID